MRVQIRVRCARSILYTSIALIAAACSGVGPGVPAAAPTVPAATPAPTGPIIGISFASTLDDKGQPVEPSFSFEPNQRQITAIVKVGKVRGSPLTITWSSVSDDGHATKLFEHQFDVQSDDVAYSTAQNPSTLAEGSYRVTATLEGQTQLAEVDVRSKSTPETVPAASNQGKMPESGKSGKTPRKPGVSSQPPASKGNDCLMDGPFPSETDPTASVVDFFVGGACGGNYIPMQVAVTLNGETRAFTMAPLSTDFFTDPCGYAKGSDLPGTKVHFEIAGVLNGQLIHGPWISAPTQNGVADITLGPDTLAPRLDVHSTPPQGTRVKAGDQIQVNATATEPKDGGPWQTGVQMVKITVHPSGDVIKDDENPNPNPQPCGQKAWNHKTSGAYTVPPNPPDEVKICVHTEDYAKNLAFKCATFPTGETWSGTIHSETNGNYGAAGNCVGEAWDMTFSVKVAGDGIVTGSGSGKLGSMPKCSGPGFNNDYTASQAHNVEFSVSGKKTALGFELQLTETKIDGGTAGLLNYSLVVRSANVTLSIPFTDPANAEGVTRVNRPATGGVASAAAEHQVKMQCTGCK